VIGGQSLRFQYDYIQFTAQTGGLGGWETGEKRGREVYRRWEKRGQEVGFPSWQEAGEKGEIMQHYCAIFCNRKTAKRNRAGTSITGYGKQEV